MKIPQTKVLEFEITVIASSMQESNLHPKLIESYIQRHVNTSAAIVGRSKVPVDIKVALRPKLPPLEERIANLERTVDSLLGPED